MVKTKSVVCIILVIFLVSALSGCAGPGEEGLEPRAEGKALYDYITAGSNYKNWDRWPGLGEFYPRSPGSPHGDLLTTYVSGNALSAIQDKKGILPDESIVVKENYMSDKTLAGLTVMYKEKDYDPQNNDWFWAKYGPDGTVQAEGKVEDCINCHGQRKDNDYIFSSPLK